MLKVKGLVALERRVREHLRSGVSPADLPRLQGTVEHAVTHVEAALARLGLGLDALPTPTRNAFGYLKSLDLQSLPATQPAPAPRAPRLVSVSNVTATANWAAAALAELAAAPDSGSDGLAPISARIARAVTAVERVCARHDAAPSSLRAPTRRAYGWLKFLTVPANLTRHLDACRRASALAAQVTPTAERPRVEFTHTAALWRRTHRGGVAHVRLAEGLIAADDAVLESVLRAALNGGTARYRKDYVAFTETDAYRDVLLELDLAAEVDADQARGAVYDLRELFEGINAAYFGGEMAPPRLTWSDRLTSRRLGYFEPQRDRIVVSRTLDAPRVPRFVVEYILYHELLHRKLGGTWSGARLRSHTARFRREERKFAHYRDAEEWMRRPSGD